MNAKTLSEVLAEGAPTEYYAVAGKATPPIAVSTFSLAGVPLEQWVLIATLVYTVMSGAHLVYKFLRDRREERRRERDGG